MQLNNVHIMNAGEAVSINTENGKITGIQQHPFANAAAEINFENAFAIPGLINSHDHLDFNCFSPFGDKKYNSYREWGHHIHQDFKEEIDDILRVPRRLRALWGMYKNLLAGITTVVNHGDFLHISNRLISILQDSQSLHSVSFQSNWKWKLNNPLLRNRLCVIHAGEGVDEQSTAEIDQLISYNLLPRKLVGVHGVAMKASQAEKFEALIWCPESNMVLFDKHAEVEEIRENTVLLFGTDSTLTARWNVWEHLRVARSLNKLSDEQLFESITASPGKLWRTNAGELLPGRNADIVVIEKTPGKSGWDDVFTTNPENILLVLHQDNIRMFDKSIASQVPLNRKMFTPIIINGRVKYVEGNLAHLVNSIHRFKAGISFPFELCG